MDKLNKVNVDNSYTDFYIVNKPTKVKIQEIDHQNNATKAESTPNTVHDVIKTSQLTANIFCDNVEKTSHSSPKIINHTATKTVQSTPKRKKEDGSLWSDNLTRASVSEVENDDDPFGIVNLSKSLISDWDDDSEDIAVKSALAAASLAIDFCEPSYDKLNFVKSLQ